MRFVRKPDFANAENALTTLAIPIWLVSQFVRLEGHNIAHTHVWRSGISREVQYFLE